MGELVLILTLLNKNYNAGQGGLAMETFNTKQACELAGSVWKKDLKKIYVDKPRYICVPKG